MQNVLVVEDDSGLSELVGGLLTQAGYRSVTIADHALIGEAVGEWWPRCVILDGELKSTGESRTWDDAAALRQRYPTLPVVMFSADNDALAEARAGQTPRSRAAGFAGFVSKPFAVDDFLATVKQAIEADLATVVSVPTGGGQLAADVIENDLVSTVVHELRQPLTVIRGQLQLGLRHIGPDSARGREAIDLAILQVDRMSRLISELLDSAGLTASRLSLKLVSFDLVAAVVEAIGIHENGDIRRVSFQWPHGAVRVLGDPDRIVQILDNMLSNALKYSAPGSPVQVTLTIEGADVEVRVADHGIGVPEEERGRLFTPFFRTSSSSDIAGTGLGLHISRRLAERQGGRLWLEASSGAGSVFTLALPVATDEPEEP